MRPTTEEQILEKLELLVRLVALQVGADKSVTERVRVLKLAGFDNRTIAEIVNISEPAVRALLANVRKVSRSSEGPAATLPSYPVWRPK